MTVSLFDGAKKRAAEPDIPTIAEDQLALAFADRHMNELRYVAQWGRWLKYDGIRWTHENTLHAFDLARTICRDAAAACTKPSDASGVSSAKTIAAVERLAKADRRIAATTSQWDAHPWTLNAYQYVNLHTGISTAPNPQA